MFRTLCVAALLLHFTLPLQAADEAKPNTLTPKEVEEGWILLFDGETTFGWKIDGDAAVVDGALVLGGKQETSATATTQFLFCRLDFDADADNAKDAKLTFNAYTGPFIKAAPPGTKGWYEYFGQISPGDISVWARSSKGFVAGRNNPNTTIGFSVPAGQKLMLRNIRVLPREAEISPASVSVGPLQPIFNGKDLSGWKKFDADPKRAKSEFTVAKEGWIHLKDGPGDLQTEKEWGDFILQIECFSNGDKLNSGVFFRCRPGEYQNGYEAQIHNGFTEKAEKEYPIEEYDPKSHKLTGTKKEKFQAMDYGTGGIYRRMPARRPVAKDKEWFTMTVAAQGRHIATWVNGNQVVDWIDNRSENDNARNGCKLGKGPISLQGHDATTDLRFRNIRIAELPAVEKKEK
jgi:hypothetical protein